MVSHARGDILLLNASHLINPQRRGLGLGDEDEMKKRLEGLKAEFKPLTKFLSSHRVRVQHVPEEEC